MILSTTTLQHLQAFSCQVLHDADELREMTAEELTEVAQELTELKTSILADICCQESAEFTLNDTELISLP